MITITEYAQNITEETDSVVIVYDSSNEITIQPYDEIGVLIEARSIIKDAERIVTQCYEGLYKALFRVWIKSEKYYLSYDDY